ncbi:hypothetical protein [Sphingomonas sp. Leaf4]|uniref:hypothetical protein n=1 Tax=Sphingomonas sp. Leaf4 TaxID=2876553 RepID=UPI001E2C279A|nr:hypothetical protein [Sphingomonas sp. Leaf4]
MRILLPFAPLVLLAACVPPAAPPAAMPDPVPPVRPVAVVAPPPAAGDWRDDAVTPGDWQYRGLGNGSVATYGARGGATLATLRCDAGAGQVTLMLASSRPAPGTIAIRTSSTQRSMAVRPVAGGVALTLPAGDRLLDAIGFSRGRFVIEGAGVGRLVLPAWAEILRVTEDCRR